MGHGPHAAGVLRIVPYLVVMLLGPSIASSASLVSILCIQARQKPGFGLGIVSHACRAHFASG